MHIDDGLATWLATGAIVAAFGALSWIVKRWIGAQSDKFDSLDLRIDRVASTKIDKHEFNGWSQRVDAQFQRILEEQQRSFAESREERHKQGEKIDEMLASTQEFNLKLVERIARLENVRD